MRRHPLLVAILSVAAAACGAHPEGAAPASSAAASTTSSETRVVRLRAEDQTDITLTYAVGERVGSSDRHQFATDVVIDIANDAWRIGNVGGGRAVRVVLLSECRPDGGGAEGEWYNQQIDIPYTELQSGSGFGYEQQLAGLGDAVDQVPMGMTSIAGMNACRQEIAVVVDGVWLVDPVNGTHNFQFVFGA
jgi:hypothetical protein